MRSKFIIRLRLAFSVALFSGGLVGYPLVAVISEIVSIDNRALSIAYRGAFLLIACIYIISKRVRPALWYKGNLLFMLAIFWSIYLLRLLEYQQNALDGNKILLFALGSSLFPSLAFLRALKPEESRQVLLWTISIAALSVIGIAYILLFSGWYDLEKLGRAGLSSLNPISVGHAGVSLGLLSLYFIMKGDICKGIKAKVTFYMLLGMGLGVLLLSASRGPLLAFLVCSFVAALLVEGRPSRIKKYARIKFMFIIFLLVISSIKSMEYIQENIGVKSLSRVEAVFSDRSGDDAIKGRFIAWRGAWEQYLDDPIIGKSFIEKNTGYYSHNAVLEAFMVTGSLGGIGYILWMLAVINSSVWILKSGNEHGWIALIALQYLIGSMFSGAHWGNSTVWYYGMAAISNAYFLKRNIITKNLTTHGAATR